MILIMFFLLESKNQEVCLGVVEILVYRHLLGFMLKLNVYILYTFIYIRF